MTHLSGGIRSHGDDDASAYFSDRCGATVYKGDTAGPCGLKNGHGGSHEIVQVGLHDSNGGGVTEPRSDARLWEIIGCAEAHFEAETDDEANVAEQEFYALLNAAREEREGCGRAGTVGDAPGKYPFHDT